MTDGRLNRDLFDLNPFNNMTTKPLNWSSKIWWLLWIISIKNYCDEKNSLYSILFATFIFTLFIIDGYVPNYRCTAMFVSISVIRIQPYFYPLFSNSMVLMLYLPMMKLQIFFTFFALHLLHTRFKKTYNQVVIS